MKDSYLKWTIAGHTLSPQRLHRLLQWRLASAWKTWHWRETEIIFTFGFFDRFSVSVWETLDERRQNHKSIMMYKVLNGIAPAYLKRYFSCGADTSRYFLRGSGVNLSLPKPNTDYMKKSFKFSGAKLWNSLPVQLKLLPTLSTFKRGLASQTSVPN